MLMPLAIAAMFFRTGISESVYRTDAKPSRLDAANGREMRLKCTHRQPSASFNLKPRHPKDPAFTSGSRDLPSCCISREILSLRLKNGSAQDNCGTGTPSDRQGLAMSRGSP